MKKLLSLICLVLFVASCNSVKLTHKCNGDKICRCDATCNKSCTDCKCK